MKGGERMRRQALKWFELGFPAGFEPESVSAFVRSLSTRSRRGLLMQTSALVVEVEGRSHQVSWRVGLPSRDEAALERLLRTALPTVRLTEIGPKSLQLTAGWELRTSNPSRPLRG